MEEKFDLSLEEALDSLTGFEIIEVRRTVGMDVTELKGEVAHVMAYILMRRTNKMTKWADVANMSVKSVQGMFAEADPSEASN